MQQTLPASSVLEEASQKHDGVATAVMFRNLPRKYNAYDLLREISCAIDAKQVDFVYLPWDTSSHNIGYAFVNFVDPWALAEVFKSMDGASWHYAASSRKVKILPASVHGLAANLEHCEARISPSSEKPVFPVVFLNGEEVGFQEALRLMRAGLLVPVARVAATEATLQHQPQQTQWQKPPHQQQVHHLHPQQVAQQPRRALPRLPIVPGAAPPVGSAPRLGERRLTDIAGYWSGSTSAPEPVLTDETVASRASTDTDLGPSHCDSTVVRRMPQPPVHRSLVALAASTSAASVISDPCPTALPPVQELPNGNAGDVAEKEQDYLRRSVMQSAGYEHAWQEVQLRLVELILRARSGVVGGRCAQRGAAAPAAPVV